MDDVDFLMEHTNDDDTSYEIFGCLTEHERKIVYLKYVKGLTAKEIERDYFISTGNIYYELRIIKDKLKKALER